MGDTSNLILGWRTVMMSMVCLPILICIVLLLTKKVERLASAILAGALFTSVLAVGPQILGFAGFYNVWPGLTFFPFETSLWLGPLLFLHTYSLLNKGPLGWRKWLFAPGIIQTSYYSWAFLFLGDYKAKWAFTKSFHVPYVVTIESILAVAMLAIAIYKIWHLYQQYQTYLQNTESMAIEFEPVWIKRIIIIILIAGLLFSSIEIGGVFTDLAYTTVFPIQVLIMMSIAWLSIEAVWRLNQKFPKLPDSLNDSLAIEEIVSSNDEQWLIKAQAINDAVIANLWYLEPRFSLRQLAKNMGSNDAYISKAINQGLNQSFNDFINRLRVESAQQRLVETDQALLSVALDSGFNSKATFNRVFKETCGETPSHYRKHKRLKS